MSTNWIESNMQRQRKLLEDKQKQKRNQSAGSVRTTSTPLSVSSGFSSTHYNQNPSFESSLPFGMTDSINSSTFNSMPMPGQIYTPTPAPRANINFGSSGSSAANEPLISLSDGSDQDISLKLSKQNLSSCVTGSDDDSNKSHSSSPWNSGDVPVDTIQGDLQPDLSYITANLAVFVDKPGTEHTIYKCSITRNKNGMDKGMFPTYFLHLDVTEGDKKRKLFLLAARKRKKSTTANYLITTDPTNLSKDGHGYCAKVRSNVLGTQFTIYNNGQSPKKTATANDVREELAAVIYETNVLGFKGPRKMTIVLPGIEPGKDKRESMRARVCPMIEKHTLLERHRLNDLEGLKILNNKSPQWNDETQSYVLNFHGRVTQASVKNFQIIHNDAPEYIVMQFGRVSDEEFTMDFKYPLSAIQAFGIAMTSFHGKLACE